MKISFDLDDTIISTTKFSLEKKSLWSKIVKAERIRLGTIVLFKKLRTENHKIYIYTTSYRSKIKIKLMFLSYGIPVDFVINQQLHDQRIRKKGKIISKFPPEFDIDVHVDDSLGVEMEGKKFGFKTIVVSVDDINWVNNILKKIDELIEIVKV
jgi:FMN phosphatase YigB (HAD superfamily)